MQNSPGLSATAEAYYFRAAEELQQRRTARTSLLEFVRQGWAEVESVPFVDNWHVGAICEHLQAVTTGQIPKLLINVPPGMGKSLLTCVFWPAWEWAIDPRTRWLFASYDQQLSTRDAVRCRALMNTSWYRRRCRQQWQLGGDQNQKTYFENSQGGYRLSTSVGGHASGEHPDRIVCDDPHNVRQAESQQERRSGLDWWDLTMSTRGVSRNARRVIIMQRLHCADLAGHVLEEGGWVHLCLPMRFEPGRMLVTPLGWTDPRTEAGTLLCPQQFSDATVGELEKRLGAYGSAGQLQQRPVPLGGGMFKEDFFRQRRKAAPYGAKRVRYWDLAASAGTGCYTAGALLALAEDGNYYVENVVHGQWGPDERDATILATARRDQIRYGPHNDPVIYIEQEPGSSGIDAYRYLAKKLAGFKVQRDRPTGSKEVRAEPWASQCAADNVYLVDDGGWDVNGFVKEHCSFPLTELKDRVDSAAGAFAQLVKSCRPDMPALQVVPIHSHRNSTLQIVVCTADELADLELDARALLVHFTDAPPLNKALPTHSLGSLLDSLVLQVPDLDPADLQDRWDEELPPYGRKPAELIMTRAHCKKLWALLKKKRDPWAEVFVFSEDGQDHRRVLSVAYAVCDNLALPRESTIYQPNNENWKARKGDKPPNQHIYSLVKSTSSMAIGEIITGTSHGSHTPWRPCAGF